MILRRLIVSVLALGIACNIAAQTETTGSETSRVASETSSDPGTGSYKVDLPQLLPASPEPTAFVKAGVGNANLSTGAASANIPLYTIKIKDYSFPISLSYSTQGLKADEASSRVGLGWVLNATAMITRSVKGKPDEFAARKAVPADFTTNSDAVYNYCMDASSQTSGDDNQPDEFQFNCNGYSGKFVLDNNYIPRVTSTSNVLIDVNISVTPGSTSGGIGTIVLTTPDGVKYTFGNSYEITTSHNIMAFSSYKNVTKTAFFLDKIELPAGDYILFNYIPINTTVVTGISQTLQVPKSIGYQQCGGCSDRYSYTSQEDAISYRTRYLSSITASNGLSIDLMYEQRPDGSGDNRLKILDVQGLKKYEFHYYDVPIPAGASVVTGRFFLTKIRDIQLIDAPSLNFSLDYTFTYDHMEQVPLPVTYSQDYLGYYNGNSSNNCLIPPSLNAANTIDFSFRNPNVYYTLFGTLTSIQYPTGGTEEFFYEGNTYAASVKRNTYTTAEVSGIGSDIVGMPKIYSVFFTVLKDQTVTMKAYADDVNPDDDFTEDPMAKTVKVNLYDGTTNIASRQVLGYKWDSTTIHLAAGHTYKLEITVTDYRDKGYASIYYDYSDGQAIYDIVNKEIPGVRLKQIKYTDPVASSTYSKYYTYATLDNLQISTGGLYGIVDFHSVAIAKTYCGQYGEYETDCQLDIYSSSSTNDVYNLSGSGSLIYYKTVIESDDPNLQNGGTEYTFYNNERGGHHEALLGGDVPYLPEGQHPTLSGAVHINRIFNKNKEIIRYEQDDYETLIYLSNAVTSIYARKRYEPWPTRPDRMDAFDVVKMLYGNYWIRLKTKTVNTYAEGTMLTEKTDYTYGTTDNIQPQTVLTTDSKGVEIKTENKYPTDFPADPVYSKMAGKNLILPAVQQSLYRNGTTLLQQKKTIYKDWFNDSKILMPEAVQVKESASDILHNELLFDQYDSKGNALQLHKTGNIYIAYIWDNMHGLPVCEIQNAAPGQVAYTSFENSVYGNWQINSGSENTTSAFTGSRCFTGSIQKEVSVAGTYYVTLWTSDNATVNGTNGTLLRNVNGWNLYQWVLINPGLIMVQGTNIDEVRLVPAEAVATGFTYIPFVGVRSRTDNNNDVTYYEYDGYNRLLAIRDIHKNILKLYNYEYLASVDRSPQWQATGNLRCVKDADNNNTGEQEKEEKDVNPLSNSHDDTRWISNGQNCTACETPANWVNTANTMCEIYEELLDGYTYTGKRLQEQQDMSPCSPTYTRTRWISLGCDGTCTPVVEMWTATGNTRCVKDASGNNTGEQEKEEKDMNACSDNYNRTRWVSLGYNCTACTASATPNWQATGQTRCVKNASGYNTGELQKEEKDINHCSDSYDQPRWVSLGQNCTTCPITNCTAPNQKVINCQCETGTRVNSSSVYMKNASQVWVWRCTYHYVFSDCSVSPDYTEDNSSPCSVGGGCGVIEEF